VLADGMVLIGGFDRRLHAVEASTGQEKWSFEATDWIWTTPLVASGTVYFGDVSGKIYAVSLASGDPLWREPFDAGATVVASPALSGGSLVIVNEDGDLFGLDAGAGTQVWGPVHLGKTVRADLVASGSTVFVAPTGCISEETGNKLYYYKVNTSTRERQSTGSVC
jgi:outer membrane protein assembly factor BamB